MAEPLLEVRGLVTELATERGPVRALDGVDLTLQPGQTLGLVGESGCGKSLLALSVLGLLPEGTARITGGSVRLGGAELAGADPTALRAVRGRKAAMVFQEPMTSLNPVFTVGDQLAEVIALRLGQGRAQARARAVELLRQVGLSDPEDRARQYPHQLSGGMLQRVMLALALSCDPALLIADEPTSALDATVQAQVLELIAAQQRARGLAVLLISHDLALVARHAEEVAVMYAGRVVERAPTAELFASPRHPYTQALLRCIPSAQGAAHRATLPTIPGAVPSPWDWPTGCRFRDRCPRASETCEGEAPPLQGAGHDVACFHPEARP
jgi:peptide/nickel transport system ATP-binding protein